MITSTQQNAILKAFSQLETSGKISKAPLNTLSKLVNSITNVKNSSQPANIFKMSTQELGTRFNSLQNKLNNQDSKMYQKKNDTLNALKQQLVTTPAKHEIKSKQAEKIQLEACLNKSSKMIESAQQDITETKGLLRQSYAKQTELLNPTAAQKEERVSKLTESNTEKLNVLQQKYNSEVGQLKQDLANLKDRMTKMADKSHIKNFATMLDNAEKMKIKNDNGSSAIGNVSWKSYICSDEFAMKHFGSDKVAGKTEYSKPIKVPSQQGKQFQKLVTNYFKSRDEHKDLTNQFKTQKAKIEANNKAIAEQPFKDELTQLSNKITELENKKKIASSLVTKHENILSQTQEQLKQVDNAINELKKFN